jgi:hypothetical protein
MNAPEQQLRSQLRRLSLRWWLYRAIETVGLALLITASAGLAIVPLFAWQGESSWRVSGLLLSLAVIVGGILASRRRPSEVETAVKADQQWKLDDLLSTATALCLRTDRAGVDEPIKQMIVVQAAKIIASHKTGELILHRFGRQTWATIGLSTALLISLTAICSHPLVLRAALERNSGAGISNRSPIAAIGKSMHIDRSSQTQRNARSSADHGDEDTSSTGKTLAAKSKNNLSGQSSSTGGGNSSTDDASAPSAKAGAASNASNGNQAAGGNGEINTTTKNASGSGQVTATRSTARPAPWHDDHWTDQQSKALNSLDRDPPPAAYRDLIREYFSR